MAQLIVLLLDQLLSTEPVDRAMLRRGHQPGARFVGNAVLRPLLERCDERVLSELANEVSASRSKPRFLDVTAYGIHKGTVVVRLAGLLGIPTESVAVIGDGFGFGNTGRSIVVGPSQANWDAAFTKRIHAGGLSDQGAVRLAISVTSREFNPT